MNATIKDINDQINFGELKGQSFIEIFKFNYTYLEWIIRKTEICFKDLDEFFKFGNPFAPKYMCLSKEAKEELMLHVVKNNRLSIYNGRQINYKNIKYLKDSGMINYKDLEEFDYHFPDDVIVANSKKLEIICNF